MAMDTKHKLVIVRINTIGESYCSPTCNYFQEHENEVVEGKVNLVAFCTLIGQWTSLKKNNVTKTYIRTKVCKLKEVKIKKNAV
jgi:hypothetical protein